MPYVIAGEMPKINTKLIPRLERRMIGRTFYEAMERFYADPDNRRRFEVWLAEREAKAASSSPN